LHKKYYNGKKEREESIIYVNKGEMKKK
jgi:hypothetical protein